jgi:hypothetical protein
MVSEKLMEDAISSDPGKYLKEKGLRLVARQYSIGSYFFDLLFEDRHGAKLIVELQKGTLDRTHTYKILDYYDEYKDNNPNSFIELMVIANRIPHERRRRLESHGISWMEIPESEFIDINNIIERDKINANFTRVLYQRKTSGSQMPGQWDEFSFFTELQARKGAEVASVAKMIIEWGRKHEFTIDWGKGESNGGFQIKHKGISLISVKISGKVTIWFYRLHHETQAFRVDEKKFELLDKLNKIKGISISPKYITKEPSIPIPVLIDESSLRMFLEILDWLTHELNISE